LMNLGAPGRGLLGELLNSTESYISEKEFKRLKAYVKHIGEATSLMRVHIEHLFRAAYHLVEDIKGSQSSDYNTQVLITQRQRTRPDFAQLQATWGTLVEFFDVIADAMSQLNTALNSFDRYAIPGHDDLRNGTSAAAHFLNDIRDQLHNFIMEPDSNSIYWMTLGQATADVVIHAAPLHIGPLVEQYIWQNNDSVIMTSATLRTHDNFDFVRGRLFADHVKTVETGSPFDYQDSTLVFIPDDIPEPNNRHPYQQAVERGLIELAAALDGRVMALFTSYTQLRQTAQAITPRLALGGITVYDQSDGTSREALLTGFKGTEKSVLLGTRSFWEGVDIPGESLSALVIVRLPFSVPSDPIFAARAETYTDSFKEYALPDAVLRFRQGFGRLIRTRTDRGVVTVFDSRIVSKSYGNTFIESLPNCTIRYGPLSTLPEAARGWLNRDRE
jgi:ATP-dependent DNA helicase DinG